MDSKNISNPNAKKTTEVQAPQRVKYQCLHTTEVKECTCIRSKGLVLKK